MNEVYIKANFSRLMQAKYKMTKESLNGYFENKEKEESYENKKRLVASIGLCELLGTATFGVYNLCSGSNYDALIGVVSAVAVVTTAVALVKDNPYTKKEYEKLDTEYKEFKEKVKRRNKERNNS